MSCEEFNFSKDNKCTHITIGVDFSKAMTRKDKSTGTPHDITGRSYVMTIKDFAGGRILN